MALTSTSHKPARRLRLEEHHDALHSGASRSPDLCCFSGSQPYGSVSPLSGVTLDSQLTWSSHTDQGQKKAAQKLGVLSYLLNRSGLSLRNGILLYRQLIRPIMDYVCPTWRSASRCHVRKLHVLQCKRLHIVIAAPLYIRCRQIQEHLGVLFFADHMRALPEFWLIADADNPLFRQFCRYLRWPRALSHTKEWHQKERLLLA